MRTRLGAALALLSLTMSTQMVSAHCEIPCGIYGDEQRIEILNEHIATVEKSMQQAAALSQEEEVNYNQLVRWVMNKETHAEFIQEIVFQYFMTQRVKPVDSTNKGAYDAYVAQLTTLHGMAVHAMKAKQTTDLQHVEALRELLSNFKAMYFGEAVPAHDHSHGR
jgi:nickel superoxide dismutase